MIHVLIAYRRSTQQVLDYRVFGHQDLDAAMAGRAQLDRAHWGDQDIEVVVLMGESEDSIRETHGRYFLSAPELVDRLSRSSDQVGRRLRPRVGEPA